MAGRRNRVLVTTAAIVITLAACGGGSESRKQVISRAEPVTLEAGLQQLTPDHSLPRAEAVVIAPTGTGVFLVGSQWGRGEGSAWAYHYDTAQHELTTLAPPPFSPGAITMSGVWTGTELLVVAGLCQDRSRPEDEATDCGPEPPLVATAYDPKDDSWTEIPKPDAASAGLALGWTGREAVFQFERGLQGFDPSTRAWRTIPYPTGAPRGMARICLTPDGLIGWWTQTNALLPDYMREHFEQGISFAWLEHGATTWQPIETPRIALRENEANMLNGECGDRSFLVTNRWLDSVWLYDLDTRQWRAVSRPPIDMVASFPSGAKIPIILDYRAWTGREFLLDTIGHPWSHALALDPTTGTWRQAQPGPQNPHPSLGNGRETWRDGTAFGADLHLWSWSPPNFSGELPPINAPTPAQVPVLEP